MQKNLIQIKEFLQFNKKYSRKEIEGNRALHRSRVTVRR